MTPQVITVSDAAAAIRAELAIRGVKIYALAGRVGLHPDALGRMLSGRRPMPPELAQRILAAAREA